MREIKFRAWNKKFKIFAPECAEFHFDGENSHLHFDVFNGNFDTDVWDFSECEIMQYTELKDKNGVEVYERDIVEDELGLVGEVKFYDDTVTIASCGCCYTEFGGSGFASPGINISESVVIGNIYENPELLENNDE